MFRYKKNHFASSQYTANRFMTHTACVSNKRIADKSQWVCTVKPTCFSNRLNADLSNSEPFPICIHNRSLVTPNATVMSQRAVTGAVFPLPLLQWFKCENPGLHTSIERAYIFNRQSCLANGTDVTRLIDFPLHCRHCKLQSLYVYDPEGDQSCGRDQII